MQQLNSAFTKTLRYWRSNPELIKAEVLNYRTFWKWGIDKMWQISYKKNKRFHIDNDYKTFVWSPKGILSYLFEIYCNLRLLFCQDLWMVVSHCYQTRIVIVFKIKAEFCEWYIVWRSKTNANTPPALCSPKKNYHKCYLVELRSFNMTAHAVK